MNKRYKLFIFRCLKVLAWSDRLNGYDLAVIREEKAKLKMWRGYKMDTSVLIRFEYLIENKLSPQDREYLRTHNVGPRAYWMERFAEDKRLARPCA